MGWGIVAWGIGGEGWLVCVGGPGWFCAGEVLARGGEVGGVFGERG